MITFNHIHKSFNGKDILLDISGSFYPGKTNLIIGASGTGKSVLLKCIVGITPIDKGTIFYDGRDFESGNPEEVKSIRRDIGMLFQSSALFDSQTVEENVRFPLDMMTRMSKAEKQERVQFCLQRVGLENAGKKMPSEISGGMKKRVGIARAIVMNPKYLFCDEPNSGLDPQTSILIDNLIQEITTEYKITTVIVTHDMNSVMEIGENIMFLYKGRKLWEGDNQSILKSEITELNDFVYATKMMRGFREIAQ
jgi:phospholipid/cholesterol/gamma-HCH transport system ATP-binding protein